jgi:hypothetical protein
VRQKFSAGSKINNRLARRFVEFNSFVETSRIFLCAQGCLYIDTIFCLKSIELLCQVFTVINRQAVISS